MLNFASWNVNWRVIVTWSQEMQVIQLGIEGGAPTHVLIEFLSVPASCRLNFLNISHIVD